MKINTTESVAGALGLTVQRVRQIIKELGIEPETIGRAIVLSDAQVRQIEKYKSIAQAGRPKKASKK